MKQIESNADNAGLSYLSMMKNAGIGCAKVIVKKVLLSDTAKKTVVLCGKGNNGGDGFVIARYLHEKGYPVSVVLVCGQPVTDDALTMFDRLDGTGVDIIDYGTDPSAALSAIIEAKAIVDAVFGFGFKSEPQSDISALFHIVNTSDAEIVAVDLPSGVECDTARACDDCINADYTLAISCCKPAHILLPASQFCGKIICVDIGIHKSCCKNVDDAGFFSFSDEDGKPVLPERDPRAHKGSYGRVLSICGSKRYAGAAVLAAKGAVRMGAGLVTAAFPDAAYAAIGSKLTEPILLPLPSSQDGFFARGANAELAAEIEKSDAVLIGCGLGQTLGSASVFEETVNTCKCPVIIDADGINLLSANIHSLEAVKGRAIITPHPGEMSRLLGLTIEQVQENRIVLAKALAKKFDIVVVLKGANTVVACADRAYVNRTGNAGMARGGSGDLLAGMMLGLLGQGLDTFRAAVVAVYIHGALGDEAAQRLSVHGMTPSDMLDILPELLSEYE